MQDALLSEVNLAFSFSPQYATELSLDSDYCTGLHLSSLDPKYCCCLHFYFILISFLLLGRLGPCFSDGEHCWRHYLARGLKNLIGGWTRCTWSRLTRLLSIRHSEFSRRGQQSTIFPFSFPPLDQRGLLDWGKSNSKHSPICCSIRHLNLQLNRYFRYCFGSPFS
jgi:hypothetical protein